MLESVKKPHLIGGLLASLSATNITYAALPGKL
jgi:hypothetical protein